MDVRKIKLPLGDIQAVREVADKVNAAQGLVIPRITRRRCLQIRCIWTVPLCTGLRNVTRDTHRKNNR
jgi:hypothetical protein